MDNKKMYAMIITGILVVITVGVYFGFAKDKIINKKNEQKGTITSDEKRFKKEYESLNGVIIDEKEKAYLTMNIPSQNKMVYSPKEEILSLLEKGTGIIYFGFSECPWCRNAVPVLLEAAKEEGVSKIYYYNAKLDRDEKTLKDGKIEIKKEGTNFYNKLLEKLGEKASVYEGLNDENIKRLYFPTVVFVKEGKIIKLHESTVDSQNDPSIKLTSNQKEELKNIYVEGITSIYSENCEEKC